MFVCRFAIEIPMALRFEKLGGAAVKSRGALQGDMRDFNVEQKGQQRVPLPYPCPPPFYPLIFRLRHSSARGAEGGAS